MQNINITGIWPHCETSQPVPINALSSAEQRTVLLRLRELAAELDERVGLTADDRNQLVAIRVAIGALEGALGEKRKSIKRIIRDDAGRIVDVIEEAG